jgi:glycerol uptake facilitator-like aquaporin
VVEGIGTAFLLATVVGSGIMGERLFGGHAGLTLLANSLATGAGLAALITAFGPVSGAQLNPLVTLTDAALGRRPWREVFPYGLAQVVGALAGVGVAHRMFGLPLFSASQRVRAGAPQMLGECVATFGLLAVIFLPPRRSSTAVALAVGSYIGAAYWFTSSTAFANPAVTLARSLTDTFTGIRPADVPGFWAGQAAGTLAFLALGRWLVGPARSNVKDQLRLELGAQGRAREEYGFLGPDAAFTPASQRVGRMLAEEDPCPSHACSSTQPPLDSLTLGRPSSARGTRATTCTRSSKDRWTSSSTASSSKPSRRAASSARWR